MPRAHPDRPIRVLSIIAGMDARIGGPPQAARHTAIAAARAGIDATLVFPRATGDGPGVTRAIVALEREGVKVHTFRATGLIGQWGPRWGLSPGLAWWVAGHARDYDLIHAHGAWVLGTVLAACLGPLVHRPRVVSPHEGLTRFDIDGSPRRIAKLGKRALSPLLLHGFDRLIMSSALEARESTPEGKPRARCAIVYHAVYDDRAAAPGPRPAPVPGALTLGFIGRFHPKKNLDVILSALALLPETVRLAVAGDGPDADTYHRLALSLGVAARTDWLGFVEGEAKEAFFRGIDLLLMPSVFECFGLAAAEALVRGIPAVVSPATGVAEIVGPHGGGAVCPATPEAIAGAVHALADDPDAYARAASGAVEGATAALSFSAHGAALAAIYRDLLTERR